MVSECIFFFQDDSVSVLANENITTNILELCLFELASRSLFLTHLKE